MSSGKKKKKAQLTSPGKMNCRSQGVRISPLMGVGGRGLPCGKLRVKRMLALVLRTLLISLHCLGLFEEFLNLELFLLCAVGSVFLLPRSGECFFP